jgi:hypothetical protein
VSGAGVAVDAGEQDGAVIVVGDAGGSVSACVESVSGFVEQVEREIEFVGHRHFHAEWCIRRRRRRASISARLGEVSGRAAGGAGCGEDSDAGSGAVCSVSVLIAPTPRRERRDQGRCGPGRGD